MSASKLVKKLVKGVPRFILILFVCLLFVLVVFLMNYVQNLLYSDVRINLVEVATQNKDVITSKLMLEVNNLDIAATQISELLKKNDAAITKDGAGIQTAFQEYFMDDKSDTLFVAGLDGTAYFENGETIDISGRRYFRLAVSGKQNISDRVVSRIDGEEKFIISVPLYYRGEVYGTVQKFYSPEEMYKLCSVSLFSSQGYMYIVNSDGYILISSRNEEYSQETENYFRSLYSQGNQEASKKLEEDVKSNLAGFMETTIDGEKMFSAYTPIEDLHDWYLISCIAMDAVSPNSNIVVRLFYVILFVVVVTFGVCILLFLSYKNKQQANLERIAFIDTVTQGNTYNKFLSHLRIALQDGLSKPLSLLSFDIDNFRYVNNYYGFDVGDQILRHINETITSKLVPGEMVARVSGDKFVVLLQDDSPERLDELLQSVQNIEGQTLYFSAGLYQITDPAESINLMVDKASTAAQAAKGVLHKKVIYYSKKFDQQMIQNEQLKRSVEQAIANDEMVAFYQPKINVITRELVGAEALARWRTKEGKLIFPGEFMPICEKTGLVVDLDMAIFEKTLRFLRRNLDEGIKCVPISVNFSRLHLTNRNFLDLVIKKMLDYNIPPNLIEIELTESVIFDNFDIIAKFADQLHDMGLLIAMDDFGSGYSSLNMLKDIPIDILKIDRAFLQETSNYDKQRIILSTIAKMADQLRIDVVFEGVETVENVEMIKEFGCFVAQGYYFAKPMDEPDFEKIYKEGKIC